MNLLVCVSEYYPYGSGIANVAYNVVEQLKERGVDCTICSPTGPDIKLKSLKGYGRLNLVYYWHKVYKYFKKGADDYDVVWLHNPLFIKSNPFQKSLITMHITSFGVYKRTQQPNYPILRKNYKNLAAHIERFCLSRLDLKNTNFTAVSLQVYDELRDLGIVDKKISYIPNGVDTKLFKPVSLEKKEKLREGFGIPKDSLILLSTGNLTIAKNPLKLIEIYSLIENKYKDVSMVIAGSGGLENKVRKLSEKKGIRNIIFLGHVNYEKMHNLYACSDVYIMTSLYEGLPLTLLEAMSSGLPCIVSDVTSISSMVNDAKAGISVTFDDETENAERIINFLNEDLFDYGKNAREYAVRNLDWSKIAKRYIVEFQKIIDIKG